MSLWFLVTLLALLVQGLFALFEMACVSFNKVRLQYYVSQGKKRAIWIHFLLKRPSRLFGTTLIGINAALQIGSESSRRFYESIHIDPDFAPITQVFIVVLIAELVPMTIARRYPERIAIFLSPLMMAIAKLLSPIIWVFDHISKLVHKFFSNPVGTPLFLSREEVIMTFEKQEFAKDEFNAIVNGVFLLKNLSAMQLMQPLSQIPLFSKTATVATVRNQFQQSHTPFLLIYHRTQANIVSIVDLRNLVVLSEDEKIIEHGRLPWFVTKETSILQILEQFRKNNQSVAIILETSGEACGILTLDQVIDSIFGPEEPALETTMIANFIDRTLEGSMLVAEFNRQFHANLPTDNNQTLSDLVLSFTDHPSPGETFRIGRYEITILEPSLKGAKLLNICTFQE